MRPRDIVLAERGVVPTRLACVGAISSSGSQESRRAGWWKRWAAKLLTLVVVGLVFGWTYDWAAPRLYRRESAAGFWHGTLHGALMPVALPSLLLGKDVPIYGSTNAGRSYKVGYIVGVNLCGLVFFGLAFRQPRPR